MISKNKYKKENSVIDENLLSLEQLYIYELLNYEGIKRSLDKKIFEDLKLYF